MKEKGQAMVEGHRLAVHEEKTMIGVRIDGHGEKALRLRDRREKTPGFLWIVINVIRTVDRFSFPRTSIFGAYFDS